MTIQPIFTNEIAKPVGPFSPAVRTSGFVYLSGQVGQLAETGGLVGGGVREQTDQALRNIRAVLAAAGKSLSDVARVAVYLTDMDDFTAMNETYATYFTSPFPARTCVAVEGLPLGALVEFDAVVEP